MQPIPVRYVWLDRNPSIFPPWLERQVVVAVLYVSTRQAYEAEEVELLDGIRGRRDNLGVELSLTC
jgi:hypothetical protein